MFEFLVGVRSTCGFHLSVISCARSMILFGVVRRWSMFLLVRTGGCFLPCTHLTLLATKCLWHDYSTVTFCFKKHDLGCFTVPWDTIWRVSFSVLCEGFSLAPSFCHLRYTAPVHPAFLELSRQRARPHPTHLYARSHQMCAIGGFALAKMILKLPPCDLTVGFRMRSQRRSRRFLTKSFRAF